ncbi:MAG: phytoene dehydrogenase, partial [Verrucomicrobia bacterium 21-51-4]
MQATKPRGVDGKHYEAIIIGAGLSGLAAAIRTAIAGKKVLLIERHNAPGGLNSFYSIAGRKYDVGLHALTNFAPKGAPGAPLTKILRQLRLRYEDLQLREQLRSSIVFGATRLDFSNDLALLQDEVAREFSNSIDAFNRMIAALPAFDAVGPKERSLSARAVLADYFWRDPLLVEMLLAPVMYYG